ncbi:MAG: tRNA-dihydrouridine synthase [Kiritimatiellia bacterium]
MSLPVYLAPLRGVTLCDFRACLGEQFHGISAALAPFIALGGPGRVKPSMLADVLPEANGPLQTIPQIIGKDPAAFSDMLKALRDLGYTRANLNCGCPWKFVAKKGRGSGLPENPDVFEKMLETGCKDMPNGFSVKIRLGYASTDTLAARLDCINRYPLSAIIVHPRTGIQMYGGHVHLDVFAALLPHFQAPVIYNGDLFSPSDAIQIAKRFPSLQGLMIGRGLCQNPALAEEIAAAFVADASNLPLPIPCHDAAFRARILHFAETLTVRYARKLYGPAPLIGRLKELWSYLHASFENDDAGLRKIQRAPDLPSLQAAISALTSP